MHSVIPQFLSFGGGGAPGLELSSSYDWILVFVSVLFCTEN
jgi:hypothetical protein